MLLENQELGPRAYAEKKAERCKIDYESMIKSIKEELSRSAKLRDATIEYYRDRTAQGQMAELIGELVTKCNQLEREFLRVMEQHEKDSD